jgi:predicted RNA binding protein YcfA (HicA-like mRNA interferase family)
VSHWPATKAKRVQAALLRKGWSVKRQSGGSHRILERTGWPDFVFAFHDDVEIGPRMLARIAKHTGLQPGDLEPGPGFSSVGLAAVPASA